VWRGSVADGENLYGEHGCTGRWDSDLDGIGEAPVLGSTKKRQ
jgi:hypothetical protein